MLPSHLYPRAPAAWRTLCCKYKKPLQGPASFPLSRAAEDFAHSTHEGTGPNAFEGLSKKRSQIASHLVHGHCVLQLEDASRARTACKDEKEIVGRHIHHRSENEIRSRHFGTQLRSVSQAASGISFSQCFVKGSIGRSCSFPSPQKRTIHSNSKRLELLAQSRTM